MTPTRRFIARVALFTPLALAGSLAAIAGCSSGTNQSFSSYSSTAKAPPDPFDTAQNATPNSQTLFRLSRILAAQGRDDECRYILQDLISKFPDYAPAYSDLAELHMRAGRTDEAAEVLERGLAILPKDARLEGNLGICYMVKTDYERALTCFSKAAALGSDDARHRANMAVALGMLGRYDESLAEYEKVVAPAAAHYNLSVLAKARQDNSKAAEELTVATSMDPTVGQKPAPATTPKLR